MFRRIAQLGILSAIVAVLAFVQNRLVVQTLGAGATVDAYYLALTVPMVVVTILGMLSLTLFVPLFARERSEESGGALRGSAGLGFAVSAFIGLLMLLQIPASMALGFWSPAEGGLGWLGLIALGAMMYGLSYYARSLAVAAERADWFVWSQVANALVFIALLASRGVRDVNGLAAAFAISATVQAVWVTVPLLRARLIDVGRVTLPPDLGTLLKAGLVASLAGTLLMQGSIAVDRWFAGSLGPGVVTTYYVADRVIQMILTLVATAVGLVVFPRMASADEDSGSVVAGKTLTGLVVFLAPIASVMWVYSAPVVGFLFGGGRFDAAAVAATASFLKVLGVALVPMGIAVVLPRRLQVIGSFGTYATIAGVFFASNWLLKLVLTRGFGVEGLAPASAVAYALCAVAYVVVLHRRGLITIPGWARRDMAVALGLAIAHGLLVGRIGRMADSVFAAPVSLALLWVTAAALGGRYERKPFAIITERVKRQ